MEFEKYDHSIQEKKIYDFWESKNLFKPVKQKSNKKFSVVIPPPNVTGRLHMGHALNNSLQDVLVRFYRMNGFETLWQPGTDHAGIATQAVVEKNLAREGINKNDIGRDKFIEKVWAWKAESGDLILDQLKKLGCSCDWSRSRFTMDEDLSKAVIKVFVSLYNKKLIYKDKKLVNWDTKLQTAISDLEVIQQEVQSQLYYIKYPIEKTNDFITIATTRPETMMGDTAIAVNPKDKRYKSIVGKFVVIPIVNRKIKVIEDIYADPEQGTGAVKITPAHDFNDYMVGKRNKLEIINILEKDGTINDKGIKNYVGLDRLEARKKLVQELKEKNFLDRIESIKNKVPYGDRSNSIIEPLLTEQWFVDAKKLAKKSIEVVKKKKTTFFPENWTKTYYQWMNNIEPWCISRQIWWGHRIPVWYTEDKKQFFVAEDKKAAELLAKKHFKDKKFNLFQETDVLDTWFSSALWPFATLGWPEKTETLKKFYPTSVLVTGFDIIFFWVARMLMMGNHFLKQTPFEKVYVHALVRDEKGQKMSKSKGNVIDPLDLINEFGADPLRFTLIAMASPGRDVKLSKDRIVGYRNFITKVWSANNFLKLNNCSIDTKIDTKKIKIKINQWLYQEYEKTVSEVNKHIKDFRFDEASRVIYNFVWHTYCDWYIEFTKPIFNSNNKSAIEETRNFAAYILSNILKLLHPFIPFFTEHTWKKNDFNKTFKSDLINAEWPSPKKISAFSKSSSEIEALIQIISSIRSTKVQLNIPPKEFCELTLSNENKNTKKSITDNEEVIKQVGRVSKININQNNSENNVQIVVLNEKIGLKFETNIDLQSQKERLSKKQEELEKKIISLDQKLKNKSYVSKAPKEIVETDKLLLKDLKIEQTKLKSIVSSIT
ncbi:MAG: valine--tRNA ligase [Pelagibacteraceae bacterium]